MLVATFVAIRFSDSLLTRTIEFTPESSANFTPYLYSDEVQGGQSRSAADPERLLSWTCYIRKGVEFPFCGYELLFDGQRATNGIDLSDFQSLSLDYTYHGPAELLRLSLKNYDPRYSKPGMRHTAKFNKVDVTPRQGRQRIDLHLSEFGVAEWWLLYYRIRPELSKPQLDNVISLDIGPSVTDTSKPSIHRMQVHKITLRGTVISEAQLYLLILGCWVALMAAFLIHRVLTYRREAAQKQRVQMEERERLRAAKLAAEKASRAKSEFLSGMSHELRTPLNAILGYTQLLKREDLSEKQAAAISTIHASGTHLLAMITDVLDLAKVEAGRLELCSEPFDLRALIRDLGQMMKASADQRALAFRCEASGDLPVAVVGDEKRLRQVLLNLLGNAIKFTAEGEVALRVTRLSSDDEKVRIRFEVSDTGMGIAPDQLKLIFKPFEQAGEKKQQAAGTGLGLSISERLVRLMSSSLAVESELGKGSRFWFDLELPPAERAEVPRTDRQLVVGYSGERRHALIVDDTETNRHLLRELLGRLGFETSEAADGIEALAALESARPDVVFMDLRMPRMDGFEAMRRIRAVESLKSLPVIAVSASTTAEAISDALAAGANAFVSKPVMEHELLERLIPLLPIEWCAGDAGADTGLADSFVVPSEDQLSLLLDLARAGNMRQISRHADRIIDLDDKYRPFAERLKQLAANYQSPAIMQMIEEHIRPRAA